MSYIQNYAIQKQKLKKLMANLKRENKDYVVWKENLCII